MKESYRGYLDMRKKVIIGWSGEVWGRVVAWDYSRHSLRIGGQFHGRPNRLTVWVVADGHFWWGWRPTGHIMEGESINLHKMKKRYANAV